MNISLMILKYIVVLIDYFVISRWIPYAEEQQVSKEEGESEADAALELVDSKTFLITWDRLIFRELVSFVVSVLTALLIAWTSDTSEDFRFVFLPICISLDLLFRIIKILPYEYNMRWAEGKLYRYGLDIFGSTIAVSTTVLIVNSISNGPMEIDLKTYLFFIGSFGSVLLISQIAVDLIDHFVVSQWIPYAREEKLQSIEIEQEASKEKP